MLNLTIFTRYTVAVELETSAIPAPSLNLYTLEFAIFLNYTVVPITVAKRQQHVLSRFQKCRQYLCFGNVTFLFSVHPTKNQKYSQARGGEDVFRRSVR